jgi:hypothetical protein
MTYLAILSRSCAGFFRGIRLYNAIPAIHVFPLRIFEASLNPSKPSQVPDCFLLTNDIVGKDTSTQDNYDGPKNNIKNCSPSAGFGIISFRIQRKRHRSTKSVALGLKKVDPHTVW